MLKFKCINFSVVLLWILLLLLSSCGLSTDHKKMIPKDASFATSVNMKNLSKRSPGVKQLLLNQLLSRFPNHNITLEPDKSGINWNENAYFFGTTYEKDSSGYLALMSDIEKVAIWEETLSKILKANPDLKIQSQSSIKIVIIDNYQIVAWSNQMLLFINHIKESNAKDLGTLAQSILQTQYKESLFSHNDKYKKMLNEKYDIAFWADLGRFNENLMMQVDQSFTYHNLLPKKLEFKDNYFTAISNFELGRVEVEAKVFLTESTSQMKAIFKKDIDTKLLECFPFKRPLLVSGVGIDPSGIEAIAKKFSVIKLIDKLPIMNEIGTTFHEVLNALTGDFACMLKDIKQESSIKEGIDSKTGEPDVRTTIKPDYEYIIAVGVANKSSFEKLLAKLSEKDYIEKEGNHYTSKIGGNRNIYIVYKEKHVFITTTPSLKDELLKDKVLKLDDKIAKLGSKGWLMLYSDVQEKTRDKFPSEFWKDFPVISQIFRRIETPLENFESFVHPIQDNVAKVSTVFNFKSKEKNSFVSTIEFLSNNAIR
jgi:Domain of unknown function (DUF4836)